MIWSGPKQSHVYTLLALTRRHGDSSVQCEQSLQPFVRHQIRLKASTRSPEAVSAAQIRLAVLRTQSNNRDAPLLACLSTIIR